MKSSRFASLLALIGISLLSDGSGVAGMPEADLPCQAQTWETLDCASRRDAGRGLFLELHNEIRTVCIRGERESQLTIQKWLDARCDRYDPEVATTLIETFHRFQGGAFIGGYMERLLGRQAFRCLPRAERLVHYRKALRNDSVRFDSGYVLSNYQAAQDASKEGLQDLAAEVEALRFFPDLNKRIAHWDFQFRAGAGSRREAAERHLDRLGTLSIEDVAGLLIVDSGFQFSVLNLRDELCNPVWSSPCECFKDLTRSWAAQLESRPALAERLYVGGYGNETLLQLVGHIHAAASPRSACCKELG